METPAEVATSTAGNDASDFRPGQLTAQEPVAAARPRDRQAEHPFLGEVPGRVQPDRGPQPAGQHVDGAEQDAGFDRDRGGGDEARIGVGEMRGAEQGRDHHERDPAAPRPLDEAEQDTAEQQLFGESRDDRGGERPPDRRQMARSGDTIAAERRDDPHRQRKQEGAPGQSRQQLQSRALARENPHRRALDEAAEQPIGREQAGNDDQRIDQDQRRSALPRHLIDQPIGEH